MAIPAGFNSLSCYLIVPDPKAAMELYARALGAREGACMMMPDGSVMHAEMAIGNSRFMLTQENPAWQQSGPLTLGGTPVGLHLYVDEVDQVDALFKQATEAGMHAMMPPADQFWGDRYCRLSDPWGHNWGIASQFKEMTLGELEQAKNAWLAEMAAGGEGPCEPNAG